MFHAALDLGAKGYVLKDSAIDDIVTAITEAVAGRGFTSLLMTTYFTRRQNYNQVPDEQRHGLSQLTPTESRILKLLADYKTNKDIAEELSVGVARGGRFACPQTIHRNSSFSFRILISAC